MYGGSGKNIGQENYNDIWVFDFYSLKFREITQSRVLGPGPTGMYGHSLSYFSNKLYLFGGTTGFEFFKDIFVFELITH